MRVVRHRTFRYAHETGAGVASADRVWRKRSGLILELETDTGLVGQGEAAPLEGYSPDTLEQAEESLQGLDVRRLTLGPVAEGRRSIAHRSSERMGGGIEPESLRPVTSVPSETTDPTDPMNLMNLANPTAEKPDEPVEDIAARIGSMVASIGHLPPSASFALETALFDLAGQAAGRSVTEIFGRTVTDEFCGRETLGTAILVPRLAPEAVESLVARALLSGARTFKLKVRGSSPDEDLARARLVRRIAGRDARLRLDANGSIRGDSLDRQLSLLASVDPEFVEEPTTTEALLHLRDSPVPIALDESLVRRDLAPSLLDRPWLFALVLKPMLLGGGLSCLEWVRRAQRHHLRVVISHMFDGPLAHAAATCLALSLPPTDVDSGLGLHEALSVWPSSLFAHVEAARVRRPPMAGIGIPRVSRVSGLSS